jgi:predicted nucleotidyltransferase
MHAIVADDLAVITGICRQHGVRKLEVLGSASRSDVDPACSDIHFVVDFIDYGPGVAGRTFSLIEALETPVERHVELIFELTLTYSCFVLAINESRRVICEARDRRAAA